MWHYSNANRHHTYITVLLGILILVSWHVGFVCVEAKASSTQVLVSFDSYAMIGEWELSMRSLEEEMTASGCLCSQPMAQAPGRNAIALGRGARMVIKGLPRDYD